MWNEETLHPGAELGPPLQEDMTDVLSWQGLHLEAQSVGDLVTKRTPYLNNLESDDLNGV